MKRVWKEQKLKMPEAAQIIEAGLEKLEEYRARADLVPAYILAMGNYKACFVSSFSTANALTSYQSKYQIRVVPQSYA
jgi:hypothetical protein